TEERRKQLALQFLDRHGAALAEGVGLYWRGRAHRLAGDSRRAVADLTEFRVTNPGHPRRTDALLLIVDCLLEAHPDLATEADLAAEKRRLRQARTFLRSLDRETLTKAQQTTAAELHSRLGLGDMRAAYQDLVGAIKTPDEESYHVFPGTRVAYWQVQSLHERLARERREAVAQFYRAHRRALEEGPGLLWKARALALAADARRAAESYGRFREAAPDHPEANRAALEQARLLGMERGEIEAAERVLETLWTEALSTEDAEKVQALRERLGAERRQRGALSGWEGRPLRHLPALEAIGDPPPLTPAGLEGRRTALLVFASWSEPSRALLAQAAGVQRALPPGHVRFVAVTQCFGFGWEVPDGEEPVRGGRPAGPDLAAAEEIRLVVRLVAAAGLDAPLVVTAPEILASFGALPAVVLVDAAGVVRSAAAGGEAVRILAGLANR
ncbi:MAG: hypothetical protein JXQ29_14100, partial [Planctomycetes bacterium]|nr:hypothetical protein [Planctomycetota bacterium]